MYIGRFREFLYFLAVSPDGPVVCSCRTWKENGCPNGTQKFFQKKKADKAAGKSEFVTIVRVLLKRRERE